MLDEEAETCKAALDVRLKKNQPKIPNLFSY